MAEDHHPPEGDPHAKTASRTSRPAELDAESDWTPGRAASLARSLAKAIKAVRLYPPENHLCQRFLHDVMGVLEGILREADTVRLELGRTKVFYRGEPVFEQEGRDDVFPALLFWDGIRELTFHAGVTDQEVLDLLVLLRQSERREEVDDDLVTLLWERSFPHISYIALDQLLDFEGGPDPVPEEFGRDFMSYVDLESNDVAEADWSESEAERVAQELRARLDREDPALFGVRPEERDAILSELAEEEKPERILEGFLRILHETLRLEKHEDSFLAMTQVLTGALLGRMGEGRLQEAAGILGIFNELARERRDLTPVMAEALDAARRSAWDETRLGVLVDLLDRADLATLATLDPFLEILPGEAVGALCEVLGRVKEARSRKRLIDGLIRKSGGEIAPFLPFLRDPRWYLVRNVVLILGATENLAAVEALKGVFAHPDFRVRREVLSSLTRIRSDGAKAFLASALADPDSRVRVLAARSLATYGAEATATLMGIAQARDFEKREPGEIQALYESLAYAAGESAVAFLAEITRRKSLLGSARLDTMRAAACEAIGLAGGELAIRVLHERLDDRSQEIRKAARSALSRLETGKARERLEGEAA